MPATGNQTSVIIQIGVIAMHQMGMSPRAIADIAGCARSTVNAIINNPDIQEKYANNELVSRLKKSLPDRIFAKANAVLANINPDNPDMSEAQKATVFGILFDKYQISTGQATQIIDFKAVSANIIDVDAKIKELESALKLPNVTPKQIDNKS